MEEEELMRIKSRIMIMLCIALCIMTVGFAAFSTTLTITGTADIASTWKVVFSKIEQVSKTSGVSIKETPTANGTTATFNVGFTSPGDKIVYRITIANQGTLDAVINEIKASEIGSDAILFELANINKGDILEAGDTTTFEVTIKYNENVISQPNITDNQLTVTINYVQSVGQSITPSIPSIEVQRLSAAILRNNTAQSDAGIDFSKTSEEDGTSGLYYTNKNTEDNKATYYFRGAVENNYVKFGKAAGCGYKGNEVLHIIDVAGQQVNISPTQSQCEIPVCDAGTVVKEQYGLNYRYVTGLDDATCQYLGGTPTGESGTYGKEAIDLTWRIIRINEDGSIRLITNNPIEESEFNENHNDNAYVGYMYGTTGATGDDAYSLTHSNDNPSTIKVAIDNWYSNKTNLSSLRGQLADAGFCGDRSIAPSAGIWNASDTALGYGTNVTYYGFYNRMLDKKWNVKADAQPQFKCPNEGRDLYTTKTSAKGNAALDYPIGLITGDEVSYAGGVYGKENSNYYLNNGSWYRTMSPFYFHGSNALVWGVNTGGDLGGYVGIGGRWSPVINLSSGASIISGDGTSGTPYVVSVG